MTHLIDGPGRGQTLMLKRTPVFLRVVYDQDGTWDALNEVDDVAQPKETIFVYVAYQFRGAAMVDFGGKNRRASGRYPIVDYKLWHTQPPDNIMRDNAAWRAWCETQPQPEIMK